MKAKDKKKVDIVPILKPGTNMDHRLIKSYEDLKDVVDELREHSLKIVFTQGNYDLIHQGHAKYLELAKSYGDVLIVAVDSDEMTKARKGPSRPIVPESERVEMLMHLRHVDVVIIKQLGEDINGIAKIIKPDIMITSESTKDFGREKVEAAHKGFVKKIITLPPQSTTSTSARVRDLTVEGAQTLAKEIIKLTDRYLKKISKI